MTEEAKKAVQAERDRCVACVDSVLSMAGDDQLAIAMLNRIKNMINAGGEPHEYDPFRG